MKDHHLPGASKMVYYKGEGRDNVLVVGEQSYLNDEAKKYVDENKEEIDTVDN
jgi:hypothetical protein